ncbi:MAG: apolipoprotein N-acyltransferase [Clostridia bacterium]|nr:apolipoprotein N-acyltransferase [Clostridia bacterium]
MVKVINASKYDVAFTAVSALLAALPLSFPSCFWLSWVAFVPFFVVVLKKSGAEQLGKSVRRWILFGFLFNLFVYHWFFWLHPLSVIGFSNRISAMVVLFGWITTSLLQGLLYIIPGAFCCVVARNYGKPLITAFAAVAGILTSLGISGFGGLAFPWIRISLGQYCVPILIQSASVWGIEGVDFLILSVNALFALGCVALPKNKSRCAWAAVGLFVGNLVFGWCVMLPENPSGQVQAMAVQGNIPVDRKWEGKSATAMCHEVYSRMTKENIKKDTKFVVWPETAIPVNLAKSKNWQKQFRELSQELGVPIYMGINWRPDENLYNGAVLIDEKGLSAVYCKRELVPFGERLPFGSFFEKAGRILGESDMAFDYKAGTHPEIIKTKYGDIGSVICFESIFPKYARENVKSGADVFFVITNDAWLKDSPAASQHLAHSVFRSVENRRETVRCANVGVSAFIDSRGRIKGELKVLEQGVLSGAFTPLDEKTIYNRIGYLFVPVLLLICAGICVILRIFSFNKN